MFLHCSTSLLVAVAADLVAAAEQEVLFITRHIQLRLEIRTLS